MVELATIPAISVVTPFYNRASFLPALIATLELQTCKDFELVIADDASTDGLAAAAAEATAPFPIRYLRLEKNRGAAAARNAGIVAARGRYIAFLDSDDGWAPDKLKVQLDHLEKSNDDRLVSLTRQLVRGSSSYVAPGTLMTVDDDVGEYLFLRNGVIQSSMIFLGSVFAKSTLFDETSTQHDDWSFALRLQKAGARFEMLAAPLTIYNDDKGRARRSPPYSAARLRWLEKWRSHLGEAPYLAASATVASHLRSDWRALPMIVRAMRRGAIGPLRAVYYALAWGFPSVRAGASGLRRFWFAKVQKVGVGQRELL